MCRTRLGAMALLACSWIFNLPAAETQHAPTIDKARFEAYVRYAEGFTSKVQISVDDPTPSPFKDFSRILVHASLGSQKFIRTYYVTADGKQFVNGSIWELNESPYLDVIQHLPTSGPAFGPENAKVTIVVFSDFECPYCRQLAHTIRDNVPKKYPNDVRVIFEDFPLDAIHPWARSMAEAAHCLGDNNPAAFWNFHDWVFDHQEEIKPENLRDKVLGYGKDRGLDAAKIAACIDGHATAKEVRDSQEKADLLQVQQTPTLFVNGRMLNGAVPWSTVDAVVQLELNRPKDIAAGAIPEK
ncbi:MAG: thioredoxin domain-containing protein [Acidobacteriota bacterium]|nr:thioredoxin domain-containing protein [Acidobacteriota bacterium]